MDHAGASFATLLALISLSGEYRVPDSVRLYSGQSPGPGPREVDCAETTMVMTMRTSGTNMNRFMSAEYIQPEKHAELWWKGT